MSTPTVLSLSLAFHNISSNNFRRDTASCPNIIRLCPQMLFATDPFQLWETLSEIAGPIALEQVGDPSM